MPAARRATPAHAGQVSDDHSREDLKRHVDGEEEEADHGGSPRASCASAHHVESLSHVIGAALGAISQETPVPYQVTQVQHLLTADDLVTGEDDLPVLAHEVDRGKRLGDGHSAEMANAFGHLRPPKLPPLLRFRQTQR